MGQLYGELQYVWGSRLLNELIARDSELLRAWIDDYW
jgi:hypothetical protein